MRPHREKRQIAHRVCNEEGPRKNHKARSKAACFPKTKCRVGRGVGKISRKQKEKKPEEDNARGNQEKSLEGGDKRPHQRPL